MKSKRVFVSILSILIILLLLWSFVPLSYLLRPEGYNQDNISGFYSVPNDTLDMVYIGGSACFVYWEPLRAWNRYGFTSYNFANDSLTPQAIKYYIKEVRKSQSPKLWVIDLRPFQYGGECFSTESDTPNMYTEKSIRCGTDHMLYSQNRNDLIKSSVINRKERLPYYFDFIKYHSNWVNIVEKVYTSLISKTLKPFDSIDGVVENPLKGFYFNAKTNPVKYVDYYDVQEEKKLPDEVNSVFLDLIDYCKQEGITPLFIVHSYCQTAEHKKAYNYMKRVIEESGFDFINTNDYYLEIGLDYSFDLYNENHVNVFGAEKYTDFVAEYIYEKYDLPDKRNQKEYAEWNTLYDEFEIKTSEVKKEIMKMYESQ